MKAIICLLTALTLSIGVTARSASVKRTARHHAAAQAKEANQQPATLTSPGSGTPGHLGKWINSSNLGDSSITEDKSGNVGIAAPSGSSALTVGGVIETLAGGIRFPDGSVQASAATLNHDQTLKGDGAGKNRL